MKKSFLFCMLAWALAAAVRAECPEITVVSGPNDTIVRGCPDIYKKSNWELRQGDFPGSLTSENLGQCVGPEPWFGSWPTECWPVFYAPVRTNSYFSQKTQINLARERVDGPQYSGCRLGRETVRQWDGVCQETGELEEDGCPWCPEEEVCRTFGCASPIVVDTAGDGFDLTDAEGGVSFDITGRNILAGISWTAAGDDDAWLALDRDGNGAVDSGRELFGNFTPQPEPPAGEERNGFLALAEFDKGAYGGDGDGLLSERDAVFRRLRLWRDLNHDGRSEAGELHTLAQLGVDSIELEYKRSKRVDAGGNEFRYRAKLRDGGGAQTGRWAWDVFLVGRP